MKIRRGDIITVNCGTFERKGPVIATEGPDDDGGLVYLITGPDGRTYAGPMTDAHKWVREYDEFLGNPPEPKEGI